MPVGRPSKYNESYVELAFNYCKLGATDKELAEYFKVNEDTIYEWRNVHPAFSDSIREGKDIFNTERVEKALIHSALGYSHTSEKIFNNNGEVVRAETIEHYPPNPSSLIFFLKNRNSSRWRDKQEHEHSGEVALTPVINVGKKPTNNN